MNLKELAKQAIENSELLDTSNEAKKRTAVAYINRELIENRQITKHVANILSNYFENEDTVILTPKSALTSQFRKGIFYLPNPDFNEYKAENEKNYKLKRSIEAKLHDGFPKNREINDYHHAHDAFLNAVVANYLYMTKPQLKNSWTYGRYQRNSKDVFGKYAKERRNKSFLLLSSMLNEIWTDEETGEIIGYRDNIIKNVKKTLEYRNINIVKKTEIQKSSFGDESVYKKDEKGKNFASGIKKDLPALKYGGTKKPVSAFAVVYKDFENKIKVLSVPVMKSKDYLKSDNKVEFLKKLYTELKIKSIVEEEVPKYTKYKLPSGAFRLVASYQEAQSGSQLPLIVQFNKESKTESLIEIFDIVSEFIINQKLFTNKKIELFPLIKSNFIEADNDMKVDVLLELIGVTNGRNQGLKSLQKLGLGTTAQQLKNENTITEGSIIIHQSITGLYEKRKKID